MKKHRILIAIAVMFVSATIVLASFAACNKEEGLPSWDLGTGLKARFDDNGNYGYILTVSGNGPMPDYARKDAPWYSKMGRVQQIVIEDGVTHIGSNSFFGCAAKQITLPASVTSAGVNAFSPDSVVFAYALLDSGDADLYLFSESAPVKEGNYWHFVGGQPTAWKFSYKVMFVGNSFTFREDIPKLFEQAVESFGELQLDVTMFAESSYRLVQWADASDTNGKKLDAALRSADDYDIVVLQEQSNHPINNFAEFEQGAKKLAQKIRSTQQNCRVALYATWGYDQSDPKSQSIPTMEAKLRSAYARVAQEIDAEVSQVGAAFSEVFARYPDIALYNEDNHHQSYAGAMLAAYVHAETLFGLDARECPFDGSLDTATATLLKQVAHSVVTQS